MNSLTILTLVIIAAANMAVGGCIGICGIAGFLLPMLYTGGLGFDVTYALALSFLAFLVSGIIGSFNYYKAGNLDVKMSLKLGIGSLIGAIAGVFLQSVGVALLDSVFIAIPACIGYLSRITWTEVLGLLVLIVLTHGIGVWLGSRFAGKVPVQGLKIFVAVFSVCIAIYMLM